MCAAGKRGWWWALWPDPSTAWGFKSEALLGIAAQGIEPTSCLAQAAALAAAERLWPGCELFELSRGVAKRVYRDWRVEVEGRRLPALTVLGELYTHGPFMSDSSYPGEPQYVFGRVSILKQTPTRLYIHLAHRWSSDGPLEYDPLQDKLTVVDRQKLEQEGRIDASGLYHESLYTLDGLTRCCWNDGGHEAVAALKGFGLTTVDCPLLAILTGRANPNWLRWQGGVVLKIAEQARGRLAKDWRSGDRFDAFPILADALEEAGCTDSPILTHLRRAEHHHRDCWALRWLIDAAGGCACSGCHGGE
jgi:hypothetical protein